MLCRLSSVVFVLGLLSAGMVQAQPLTAEQKAEIGPLVRAYLLDHPEVIFEAVEILKAREAEKTRLSQVSAIADNKAALFGNKADPVVGNPQGDVTLIEFLDYQCGYCKSVWQPLADVVAQDGKVRVIYKDFPILGPGSVVAARAALAAQAQGKYAELHDALMAFRGRLDEETVLRIAKSVGLDSVALKMRMEDPAIQARLDENIALAQTLGISGTPAFIVGEQLYPGALPPDALREIIAEARKKG